MATYPAPSAKPLRVARVRPEGLRAVSWMVSSWPAPVILTDPGLTPAGALAQSMVTQTRVSSSTRPFDWLKAIQGALAVAVNSKGARPLLKTST